MKLISILQILTEVWQSVWNNLGTFSEEQDDRYQGYRVCICRLNLFGGAHFITVMNMLLWAGGSLPKHILLLGWVLDILCKAPQFPLSSIYLPVNKDLGLLAISWEPAVIGRSDICLPSLNEDFPTTRCTYSFKPQLSRLSK